MAQERASIFDDDFDVSSFMPKSASPVETINREEIRKVAADRGFPSREASTEANTTKQTSASIPIIEATQRIPRRYVTGRNRQLNLKVTEVAAEKFYALCDANRWVLGEAFEMAIEALERDISQSGTKVQKVKQK